MARLFRPSSPGFTLIELLVVLAVTVILLTLAVPGLRELVTAQQMRSTSYELVADLTLARSEALKRGVDVTLAPAEGGWAQGWSVVTTVVTPVTATLQLSQKSAVGSGIRFTQSPAALTFNANGRLANGAAVARFGLSDDSGHKRCVSLDPSGRPKSAVTECPP